MTFQEQIMMAPIPTPEHMLGKGSMMPFNASNSGGRKLMYGVNLEQRLPLMEPEVPIIGTGFEYQYGQYSSSYIPADDDYTIVGIITKYSAVPKAHRYYILYNEKRNYLRLVESTSYKHFTENYGLLYNQFGLDIKEVGNQIKKGEVLLKSRAFDEYDNRMDGTNLLILYNACEKTMEDSIIISESCAKKLSSPLIHKIRLVINDNDIPLNLYGTKDNYKVMPDIGEDVSVDNGIVIGYRREKREEMLYSLSYDRLSALSLSDEKITCSGRVVDINVYSNDPSKIEGIYYQQIKYYWNEQLRYYKEVVDCLQPYLDRGATMDYQLQVLHFNCIGVLSGKQFFNDKVFSSLNVEITIIEEIPVKEGDKLTNRYGGKGVIGEIRPDYLMPRTYAGDTFDIIANKEGIYGRENMGQLFELTCTATGRQLVQFWAEESVDVSVCYQMYLQYLDIVSPSSAQEARMLFDNASDDYLSEFIGSIIMDGYINVSVLPMSENMNIDKVAKLYETFPWMSQESIITPLVDSMGQVQYVTSRRPVVVGYVYYYRLKQYAKEKFSVTSLSATNIRNENSRNKASKNYKAPFSRTPIGFGYMEIGNLSHAGHGLIAEMLMLYASSPLARESYAELMTGDPFNIDIKLDDTASNRSAEIVQTLLKAIGKRIFFEKKKKEQIPAVKVNPIKYKADRDPIKPIIFYDPKAGPEAIQYALEVARKDVIRPLIIDPLYFNIPYKEAKALMDKNEEARLAQLACDIENGVVDFGE